MSRVQQFESALTRCEDALKKAPYMFPLESVIAQLRYLVSLAQGREPDFSGLRTLDLGQIAARDIESFDLELAEQLHAVSAEARRMASER